MKKKLSLTILLILILSISQIATIKGSIETYTQFELFDDGGTRNTGEQCVIYHRSGKVVYIDHDSPSTMNYLVIASDSETILANNTQSTRATDVAVVINAFDYNSTHILVFYYYYDHSSGWNTYLTGYFYNLQTFIQTEIDGGVSGIISYTAHASTFLTFSPNIIDYGGNLWFVLGTDSAGNPDSHLNIMVYNRTDETLYEAYTSDFGGGNTQQPLNPFIFQDSNQTQNMLIAFNTGNNEYYKYYRFDMDTETFYTLATHPFTTDRVENNNLVYHMDAEVIYNGSNVWVVFTWINNEVFSLTRMMRFVQHRLVFNGSIESGELLGQNERTITYTPELDDSASPSWNTGYRIDKDEYEIYFPCENQGTNAYYIMELNVDLTDWWNYGGGTATIDSYQEDDDNMPLWDVDDFETFKIHRDFSTKYCSYWNQDDDEIRLYYGLGVYQATYDITLSYTPNEYPLETGKTYSFLSTIYVNGIGTEKNIKVYVDGINKKSGLSSADGIFTMSLSTSIEGYHDITITIWEELGTSIEQVYNETYTYYWETEDITGTGGSNIIIRPIGNIIASIPSFILVLMPVLMFSQLGLDTIVSTLIGLPIGAFIGVMSGYLPDYIIWLIILILATVIVYLLRGGGGE